jgi:hypothetical protein
MAVGIFRRKLVRRDFAFIVWSGFPPDRRLEVRNCGDGARDLLPAHKEVGTKPPNTADMGDSVGIPALGKHRYGNHASDVSAQRITFADRVTTSRRISESSMLSAEPWPWTRA